MKSHYQGNYWVGVLVALLVASPSALTAQQAVFDLSRDFSVTNNPGGLWSYGWKQTAGGAFAANAVKQAGLANPNIPLTVWSYAENTLPQVFHNGTASTGTSEGGQGVYPPGAVFFMAGNDGSPQNYGAIRLVVPVGAGGQYRLESSVQTYLFGPTSGDTDYHVVKNGAELYGQFMPANSYGGYTNTLTLAPGETLDFLVGRGQDGRQYGSGLLIEARLFVVSLNSNEAPAILTQPVDQSVLAGGSAMFSVVASGSATLEYQWRRDENAIEGETNSSLTLINVTTAQAGIYSVMVSNSFGVTTSSNGLLTVTIPPPPADFDVSRDFSTTNNPGLAWSYGWKQTLNGAFSLNTVRQTGLANPNIPLTVWSYAMNALPQIFNNGTTNTGTSEGGQGVYPPGAVFAHPGNDGSAQNFAAIRLTIPSGADGQYRLESVVKTYLFGPTSSDTDYHVVKNGVELFGEFMPANSTSGYTNTVTLLSGDTVDLLTGRGQDGHVYGSGLLIDARLYLVSAITNLPPSILAQPSDQTVNVGGSATFTVSVNGTAPLEYQWQHDGALIDGATSTSLVLSNATLADAGAYSVVVSNTFGVAVSSNATLTVSVPVPPADFDMSRDFSVSNNPSTAWSYGWKQTVGGAFSLNSVRQTGAANPNVPLTVWSYAMNALPQIFHNGTTNTGTSEGGQGVYPPGAVFAHPGNDGSAQNFAAIRLTVPMGSDGQYRLESAVQTYLFGPTSSDTDYHVVKNGMELFGQFMPANSRSGYTNTLTLFAGETLDFLVGRGEDGHVYGSGLLIDAKLVRVGETTNQPPVILVQPASRSVFVGGSVTFAVQVTGTAPLEYQWQHNGTAIEGANNTSLVLNNVSPANTGNYSVLVSNAFGMATSTDATLTVNVPPTPAAFDMSRDFSGADNPNGVWSYGWKQTLSGMFSLNTARQTGSANPNVPLDVWSYAANTLPQIFHNGTTNTGTSEGGQGVYPPGAVFFMAGNDGAVQNYGAIRLTIPSGGDGQFRLESAVQTYLFGPTSGDTDYHLVKSGVEVFGQPLARNSRGGYTNVLTLAAGDTLDFLVGRGADGQQYGSGLLIDAKLIRLELSNTPPSILVQPQGRQIQVGEELALSVVAGGSAPLRYQWRKGGVDVDQATNAVYLVEHAARADAGIYSAVVQNDYGTMTSQDAVIVVNPGPSVVRVAAGMVSNGQVEIPIELLANGNENAVGFSVSFDASRLQFSAATAGEPALGASLLINSGQAASGRVGFALALPAGSVFAEGTQQLVWLTFAVVQSAEPAVASFRFGNQPVARQVADANAHSLSAVFADGSVTLPGSGGTNGIGFEADVFPRPTGDGSVGLLDWVQIGRLVSGVDSVTNAQEFQRADCSPRLDRGDGILSASDWVQAGRYAAGLDTVTGSGGPVQPAAGGGFGPAGLFTPAAPRQLLMPLTTAAPGTTLTLPVSFESQGNENCLAFSVSFDTAKLRFVGVSKTARSLAAVLVVNTNQAGNGKVGFALALPAGSTITAGLDAMLILNFSVQPDASGVTPVAFADQPVLRESVDAAAAKVASSYSNGSVVIGGVSSGPKVAIFHSGASVLLVWPSAPQGFELYSSVNLAGESWNKVTVVPVEFGGQTVVSLPATAQSQFFRLVKP